jgi:hypothetical protein
MAGYILHQGAQVQCPHFGSAQPIQTNTRVSVSGQAIMTVTLMYNVGGCGLNGTSSPPCTTAMWTQGAARVSADGLAVAVTTGQSLCSPSGASLNPLVFQQRVTAT